MARTMVVGLCVAIGAIGHARADDGDVSHMVLADDGVTLCRHAVSWDVSGPQFKAIDAPTADCWHIDFATAVRTPVAVIALADQSWPQPSPGAHKTADGVSVCAIDNPTQCNSIHLPDADSFDMVATNAARTIVAAQKTTVRENATNIVTYDVATRKRLATFTASGDIVQVLGTTLFVQQSCAAPCGGTLYNARTGMRIAKVSEDIASANDDNNNHVTGNVWQFKETAREQGEPGLLLEDVTTGRRVKRIPVSTLFRGATGGSRNQAFDVFPTRAGLFVIDSQDSVRARAGDCALVDAKGNVVKQFAAPPWPEPVP